MRKVGGFLLFLCGVQIFFSFLGAASWSVGDTIIFALALIFGVIFTFIGGKPSGAKSSTGANRAATKTTATTNQSAATNPQSIREEVMVCPECGRKYPLTQVYCDECGSLLKG